MNTGLKQHQKSFPTFWQKFFPTSLDCLAAADANRVDQGLWIQQIGIILEELKLFLRTKSLPLLNTSLHWALNLLPYNNSSVYITVKFLLKAAYKGNFINNRNQLSLIYGFQIWVSWL